MSALKKVDSRAPACGAEKRTFPAKPKTEKPDFSAMVERAKKRFSKTLAHLAK